MSGWIVQYNLYGKFSRCARSSTVADYEYCTDGLSNCENNPRGKNAIRARSIEGQFVIYLFCAWGRNCRALAYVDDEVVQQSEYSLMHLTHVANNQYRILRRCVTPTWHSTVVYIMYSILHHRFAKFWRVNHFRLRLMFLSLISEWAIRLYITLRTPTHKINACLLFSTDVRQPHRDTYTSNNIVFCKTPHHRVTCAYIVEKEKNKGWKVSTVKQGCC